MAAEQRLTRSESDRMIAGVCGGLGEFFGVDSTLLRIVFGLLAVFGGSGIVVYLVLWLIVPRASNTEANPRAILRDNVDEGRQMASQGGDAVARGYRRVRGNDGGTQTPPPEDAPGQADPGPDERPSGGSSL